MKDYGFGVISGNPDTYKAIDFFCQSWTMNSQELLASAILLIVFFGAIGNLMSLLLFSRPNMRTYSVNVLLCALAFVDLCLLLFSIPVFVLPNLSFLWHDRASLENFTAYVFNFIYPLSLIPQTCSIYIMVLITVERWTAVCRPLQVRVWCTPKKSRLAILMVLIFAIAYNIIRFYEFSIRFNANGLAHYVRHLRDVDKHPTYMIYYNTVAYLFTHFLLPFSIIIALNGHLCWSMYRLRRTRYELTRQQQREHNTTIMLLIVTVTFAICNTLPFVMNVMECVYPTLFADDSTAWLAYELNDISNLLVTVNSATTFIVYYAFSAKYRQTIVVCCKHGCSSSAAASAQYNSLMSRTQSLRIASTTNLCSPPSPILSIHSSNGYLLKPSRTTDIFLNPIIKRTKERHGTERLKPLPVANGEMKKYVSSSSGANICILVTDASI